MNTNRNILFLKSTFIFTIILFNFNFIKAADVKGFYVNLNNDTIQAKFKIPYFPNVSIEPNFQKMQFSVDYYVTDKERKEFLPSDIKAYGFYFTNEDYENDTVIFVSVNTKLKYGKAFTDESVLFLRLVVKGSLNLYNYYYTSYSYTGMMTTNTKSERPFLQKKGEPLYSYNTYKFKSEISTYLSDCPSVVKQIEEKNYKNKHLSTVVRIYNSICGK